MLAQISEWQQTIKILILSANPRGTSKLRLDEEKREIKEGLRRSKYREQFTLETSEAVRYRDIHRAILDYEPNIVHFSGHGAGEEGLAFEDETGQVKLVETEALAGLFELFSDRVKCVVLNACYSEVQAKAIAQHIPYVVGMNKAIGDEAAIEFAVGFYDALGAGRTVEFATKLGCNGMRMAGIAEHLTPVLIKKPELEETKAQANVFRTEVFKPATSRLTEIQRRHLEQKLKEQQQEYDYRNQEIEFLSHSEKIEDLRPKERLRLKQQIAEAKQKRDEAFQSLEELGKKINW